MAARLSGRLVVAVVLTIGVGVGALGSWWLVRSRPVPGDFIDAVATPDGGAVVIRHERGSKNDFVDVYGRDRLRWRALIPRYAGAVGTPAIAATSKVVTVRVVRDGHPNVFAFDIEHGRKLASFDLAEGEPADPAVYTKPGLATVMAGAWSVEVLARPDGSARLYTMALDEHRVAWKADLAKAPSAVWLGQGGQVRAQVDQVVYAWNLLTGEGEQPKLLDGPRQTMGDPARVIAEGFEFNGGTRVVVPVPRTAVAPQPYHLAGGRGWIIEPDKLSIVDGPLGVTRTIPR
ncbi:MAG: hypothetical protein IPH80_07795 [Myxococcales bacterium]|nr:hypothetical protein [Myxococcales bacterium]